MKSLRALRPDFIAVFAGGVISCGVLGLTLLYALKARNLFKPAEKKE